MDQSGIVIEHVEKIVVHAFLDPTIEKDPEQYHAFKAGGFRPALVTVARSVEGGYTPPEVSARVEKRVIRILRNALGEIALRHDRMLAAEP